MDLKNLGPNCIARNLQSGDETTTKIFSENIGNRKRGFPYNLRHSQ
jgi:hypothetical protein